MLKRKNYLYALLIIILLPIKTVMASCLSQAEFAKIFNQKNLTALRETAKNLQDCKESIRHQYRFYIARALYQALPEKAKIKDYDEILSIHPEFWGALNDLGDLAINEQAYKAAFQFYNRTLIAIDTPFLTPIKEKISTDFITKLKNKTEEARLLASVEHGYIEPEKTRGSQSLGLEDAQIRDLIIKRRQYPIRFDYNDDKLRDSDLKYVKALQQSLNQRNQPDVTLIGHADEKGSDIYNDKLSRQRAETIRDFLLKNGYKGKISVIGKGKRQPVRLSLVVKKSLTDKTWRQLCRRVESILQ